MKIFNSAYIDEFLLEKGVSQGISKKTLKMYSTVFRLLLSDNYINPIDFSTYKAKSFKRFLGDNLLKRKWSSATYNTYRKCLKSYCNFLLSEEYIDENPFNKIAKRREPKQIPRSLTRGQVSELISSLKWAFDLNTFTGLRNVTIVNTFLYTGLRLSELTNLDMEDIKLHDGFLKVVQGKGSKDRLVPINSILNDMLVTYLNERKRHFRGSFGYLFPTINGNSLKERDMRRILKRIRHCITFYFTRHQLRHTFATELVRNNFDIYNIARILGHSRIDTTKIYLDIDINRIDWQLDNVNMFGQ